MPLGSCRERRAFYSADVAHRWRSGVAIRIGLRSGGSRNGVSADVSFAYHGVLFLGEITRREARRSQSSVSD